MCSGRAGFNISPVSLAWVARNPRQNGKIGNTINTFTTQLLLISDHIQDFIKVLCEKKPHYELTKKDIWQ